MKLLLTMVATLVLALPATASVQARPSIRIVSNSPFVVAGAGFRPGEQIRVLAHRGADRVGRTLTATQAGTFRARLAAFRGSACMIVSVNASGSRGSRAVLKIIPLCPPPIAP